MKPRERRQPHHLSSRKAGSKNIGATRQEVNRLTNLKHPAKIDRIDAALRALRSRLCALTDSLL